MRNGSLWKRLERIEEAIKFKRPRWITVAIDGDTDDHSAAEAIVQALAPSPDDLVIYIRHFGPDKSGLPRLLNVGDLSR